MFRRKIQQQRQPLEIVELCMFFHFLHVFHIFQCFIFLHFFLLFLLSFFFSFLISFFSFFHFFKMFLLLLVFFFFFSFFFSSFFFSVVRADANRNKSSRSSHCEDVDFPFAKIGFLGLGGQGSREWPFPFFFPEKKVSSFLVFIASISIRV